ncbi:hypothetical protein [Rhodococcoides kyotonense]|uniref:Uncharacterized protein n=1 Tax=Rhodococcoides kyotonense TaxID=398843 RepID=A0A239ET28_9NOCA|nr:hypothetical protein [Rhodococcus kyotonensis]SNS47173.1 hypothetical protein SAMN05421642_102525 [Rhodococcus kyotonensis]
MTPVETASELDALAAPFGFRVSFDADVDRYLLSETDSPYVVVLWSDPDDMRREIGDLEQVEAWDLVLDDTVTSRSLLMVAVLVGGRRYELSGDEVVGGADHAGRAVVTLLQAAKPEPFVVGTWRKSRRHTHPAATTEDRTICPDTAPIEQP